MVPTTGNYKLEVWGAQGGSVTYDNNYYRGGYGSYSTGTVSLDKGEVLYVNVGGSGYIGNSNLNNKAMYCYNCLQSNEESTKIISTTNVSEIPISQYAKIGNGYAKITYLGE